MALFNKPAGIKWIVVFLGNPGLKYEGTRHNAGFMCCDALEKELKISVNRLRFKALTAQIKIADQGVLLMKPQTYMNLSGDAVKQAASFYKVKSENIIVVSDDVSIPLAKLRIRLKGSAGGHNGLKDIIAKLNTEAFPRIRIGVGSPPHPDYDMADWVTSAFKDRDAQDIAECVQKAAKAVECFISQGGERAMNIYNR